MPQRIRTQGELTGWTSNYSGLKCNNAFSAFSNFTISNCNGSITTTTDTPTPGFKTRSSRGEVINTPFKTETITKAFVANGTWDYHFVSDPTTCTQCTPNNGAVLKSVSGTGPWNGMYAAAFTGSTAADYEGTRASITALAVTSAFANIEKPDAMVLVDLAEMKSTLRMMRNPIAGIDALLRRAEKALKLKKLKELNELQRKWRDPRFAEQSARRLKALKALTDKQKAYGLVDFLRDNWLQYRYGLMPLLMSIDGYYKALTRTSRPKRQTARGYASANPPQQLWTDSQNLSLGSYGWNITYSKSLTQSVSARAGVLYEGSFTFAKSIGFSLGAVPITAWELVPYSFVLDWFVNFGDWIEAVTPKADVRLLASWAVVRELQNFSVTTSGNAWKTGGCYASSGCPGLSASYTRDTKTRTPDVSPSLALNIAQWNIGKTVWQKRVADAFALTHGRLKR